MNDINPPKRSHFAVFAILLVVAAGVRIAIALCGESTLITKVLSDDAFYYFQIARNAASGNGISFDGVEPANGFHPLWFVFLLPVYLLFGNGNMVPVHAALIMEGMLDVGAGILIYSLVRRLTQSPIAGILGAVAYLFNPSVIFHSVNGLETGLNLFCFALYFWFYLRMVDTDDFSTRNFVLVGFLSGILMLARTDNFILVGVVYLHLVIMRKGYRRPGTIAASAVVAALVIAPWVIWNVVTFGTIQQSSAGAYSIVTRGNLRARGVTEAQIFLRSLSDTIRLFIWTIPTDVLGWGKLLGIIAGLSVGAAATQDSRSERIWKAARIACVPLIAFIALALAHSLLRGTLKSWYFMPAATVAAIFFGIFCGMLDPAMTVSRTRIRIVTCILILIVLSGFALNGWTAWQKGMVSWQSEQLMAARWVRENVGDDEWVGSFNAGIIGYMSGKRVVNLDGLVNSSVTDYLKERHLWDYIKQRDVTYLVDSDYSILKDYRDFYGPGWEVRGHIRKVATIDDPNVSWAGTNVGVYRVTDRDRGNEQTK